MRLSASRSALAPAEALNRYYAKLRRQVGPQGWWPARTRLEVILGAILTQNTTWHNAVLALNRLRRAGLLGLGKLGRAPLRRLEVEIRPAGFFRQKARAIRSFLDWLEVAHHGSLHSMFRTPADRLRQELLELNGLGPETADAILLYAGGQAFFVADAYTRRVLARHAHVPEDAGYAEVQKFLHRNLRRDQALFNEYHALLVEVGKRYCRRQAPRCHACPLGEFLPERQRAAAAA